MPSVLNFESRSSYEGYQILRRNGAVVALTPSKITVALMKAFLAVMGSTGRRRAGQVDDTAVLPSVTWQPELGMQRIRSHNDGVGRQRSRQLPKAFFKSTKVDGRNAP
jgi:hypothetical protein